MNTVLQNVMALIFLLLLSAGCSIIQPDERRTIMPPGSQPGGRFSPGILTDGTLYISGMGGEDASGKVPEDFGNEVLAVLDKINAVLKAAGMTPRDVVSVQVYLTDVNDFQKMNTVYTAFFNDPRPTRTTVVVARLVGPGRIEITATAKK